MLLELVFAFMIPSQTNLLTQSSGEKIIFKKTRNLTTTFYNNNHLPYYLNGTYSTGQLRNLFGKIYTKENKPNIQLISVNTNNISNYVLGLRKRDIKNLVNDYYFGMSLNMTGDSKFSASLYYSTMAFHSSGVVLNELTNLMLKFYTNNLNKSITTYNAPFSLLSNDYANSNNFLQNLACIDVLPTSILNLMNAEIVALIISLLAIHVTRERQNGFKTLQFISSVHYSVYWLSNYVFDLLICFINLSSIVVALKIVDSVKKDPTNEVYSVMLNDSAYYVLLLFFVSSFSWPIVAYVSSFFFKSDIISFVILFIILSVAAFIDMLWSFLQFFINLETPGNSYFSR